MEISKFMKEMLCDSIDGSEVNYALIYVSGRGSTWVEPLAFSDCVLTLLNYKHSMSERFKEEIKIDEGSLYVSPFPMIEDTVLLESYAESKRNEFVNTAMEKSLLKNAAVKEMHQKIEERIIGCLTKIKLKFSDLGDGNYFLCEDGVWVTELGLYRSLFPDEMKHYDTMPDCPFKKVMKEEMFHNMRSLPCNWTTLDTMKSELIDFHTFNSIFSKDQLNFVIMVENALQNCDKILN